MSRGGAGPPTCTAFKDGDVIALSLPMQPRRVYANPHVRADIGLAPQGRQLAAYDLEKALDRLADIVREHSDMETIYQSMGLK